MSRPPADAGPPEAAAADRPGGVQSAVPDAVFAAVLERLNREATLPLREQIGREVNATAGRSSPSA